MEQPIYEPGIYSPPDWIEDFFHIEQAVAPHFGGNYTECDKPPDDGLEKNDFLRAMRDQILAHIQSIDFEGLPKKDNGFRAFFHTRFDEINTDPNAAENPAYFISFAQILFNNERYDEAEKILTYEYAEKKIARWPNNTACATLLALIAEKRGELAKIIASLTDKDGKARFKDDVTACRLLSSAFNRLGRYQETVDLFHGRHDFASKAIDLLKNYLVAMNATKRYNEIIEQFGSLEQIPKACAKDPSIIGSIGIAFNAAGLYSRAYEFLRPFLGKIDFRDNPIYIAALTFCLSSLGKYGFALKFLLDENGKYRFPASLHCMKNLAYVLVNMGRIWDAERLLQWVEDTSNFSLQAFDGVRNAIRRKKQNGFIGLEKKINKHI